VSAWPRARCCRRRRPAQPSIPAGSPSPTARLTTWTTSGPWPLIRRPATGSRRRCAPPPASRQPRASQPRP
jgi:hypothetical protein